MIPSVINIRMQTGWLVAIVATALIVTIVITSALTRAQCTIK